MKKLYSRTFTSYLHIRYWDGLRHDIDMHGAHRVTHHLIALGRSLPYVRPDVLAWACGLHPVSYGPLFTVFALTHKSHSIPCHPMYRACMWQAQNCLILVCLLW